jgi:hypothetical protein
VVESAISDVSLEGPDIVPIGESVQFRLIARRANGSTRDVTEEASWSVGWGSFVRLSGPGLFTGQQGGQTEVQARFDRFNRAKPVLVVPPGTQRLYGQVREAGSPEGWLPRAIVEVVAGVGVGLSANTGWWGEYFLYGVAGEIALRVTKAGYHPTVHQITVAGSQAVAPIIELPLVSPHPDISGNYSLTIAAADECGTGLGRQQLPEEAHLLAYPAAIVRQDGPGVVVYLSAEVGGFEGKFEAGRVEFSFPWYDGEPPGFAVPLPESRTLVVQGSAVVAVAPDRVAGMLTGWISIHPGIGFSLPPSIAACYSARHQLVLSRR